MSSPSLLAKDDVETGVPAERRLYKDLILETTAEFANVAQFVSFAPNLTQRFARVRGFDPGYAFASVEEAVAALLQVSPEDSVNIRSFDPATPESRDFLYGLCDVGQIVRELRALAARGLHTIVNETIDVNDGGVSGVVLGDVVEFAPGDTPRCVEKPGVASLPRDVGLRLLRAVYGFAPELDFPPTVRVEFSLHPRRRGVRHEHTIIWQVEDVGVQPQTPAMSWPNQFSRFVGDKTFGLLIANSLGAPVPSTLVIPRWLPPYRFGRPTGTAELWLRTCPTEQQPGHFTTAPRWLDPFRLLQQEDPTGEAIAAVLAQDGVEAAYSGALVVSEGGEPIIEGVKGTGDRFMVGRDSPEPLPANILQSVRELYAMLAERLGPVRMEWVHDEFRAWLVQLHQGSTASEGTVIVPGDAPSFLRFDVANGIEALRDVAAAAKENGEGVVLVGNVGITSHFGDVLRRTGVPSRIERPS